MNTSRLKQSLHFAVASEADSTAPRMHIFSYRMYIFSAFVLSSNILRLSIFNSHDPEVEPKWEVSWKTVDTSVKIFCNFSCVYNKQSDSTKILYLVFFLFDIYYCFIWMWCVFLGRIYLLIASEKLIWSVFFFRRGVEDPKKRIKTLWTRWIPQIIIYVDLVIMRCNVMRAHFVQVRWAWQWIG